MWVDTPQGRKTWYAGRWISETEWHIITLQRATKHQPMSQTTTTLTQPAEQKSEQLISQTTTTSTSIDTKPLDGKASTENSSTGVKGWIKSIFTIMILIAILVMAYLAWKKWGKDLMQKIKNKHTSPQIKE
jgi:uncharacterized membrane protein YebE (DUF533 family)